MTKQILLLTCAVGAFSGLLGAGTVYAAEPGSGTSATEVGAVIVTAEKRQQNLQKVPVAVTAFTSKQRDLVGIENLQDMTNFTPGLVYSSVLDRVTLRGVGRQTNLLSADAAVATYVDGFFTTSAVEASKDPMFIGNVEVLRGPQGTLQGRNAIGGAILVTTARPTSSPYAEVRETVGNYNVINSEFAVSGPLADGLKARLQGFYDYQGKGYFTNLGGGPTEGNRLKEYYIEPSISAKLGDDADLYVKAFAAGWDNSGGPGARSNYSSGHWSDFLNDLQVPYEFNPPAAFGGGTIDPNHPGMTVTAATASNLGITDNPTLKNIRNFAADTPLTVKLKNAFDIDTEFTYHFPGVDLKYVGGFQEYQYNLFLDADATDVTSYTVNNAANPTCTLPGPATQCLTIFPTANYSYEERNQWYSHEFDLASTGNGALQWLGGVYYYDEHYSNPIITTAPNQPQQAAPIYPFAIGGFPYEVAAPANPNHWISTPDYHMETRSEAVFGQLDWKASDTVKLTGGLRYTADHKDGYESTRVVLFGGNIVQNLPFGVYSLFVDPYLYGSNGNTVSGFNPGAKGAQAVDLTPGTAFGGSTCATVKAKGAGLCTVNATTGVATRTLADDFSATTGTAGVEWTPNSDTLGYLRYARGYKTGGFNAGTITAVPEVASEHVNSYELGVKETFGRNLVVDAEIYYYDFQNAQYVVTVPGQTGPVSLLANVPKSKVDGFELETIWTPLEHLQFNLSYSYNNTSVQSGCSATGNLTPGNGGSFTGFCQEDTNDPLGLAPGARTVAYQQTSGTPATGQGMAFAAPPVGQTYVSIQTLAGNQLTNAPKNKFALNGNYTWIFDPGSLTFSASYIWRSEQYGALFKEPYDKAPSWNQVDMRAVWKGSGDKYEVILYGRNVFNTVGYEAAAGGGRTGLGAAYTQYNVYGVNPPATYGVELHYKFF